MVAERTFRQTLAGRDNPLDHNLGVGGNLDIDCLTADQLDGFATQETGERHLVNAVRKRGRRGIG